MKVEVITTEGVSNQEVYNMREIRDIIGGEYEIVKMNIKDKVVYIANLSSEKERNLNYPPYRGAVVKAPEEIIYKGAFYDLV